MTETLKTETCVRCGIDLESGDIGKTTMCGWCECDLRNQERRQSQERASSSLQPDCCAAWREKVKSLDAEYARLQKLIDESFKNEKEPNANAGERIPLVIKLFEVKHRADDIEALLEGKMPPDERRSKRGTQHNAPDQRPRQ